MYGSVVAACLHDAAFAALVIAAVAVAAAVVVVVTVVAGLERRLYVNHYRLHSSISSSSWRGPKAMKTHENAASQHRQYGSSQPVAYN
jgi:hypothetical protein